MNLGNDLNQIMDFLFDENLNPSLTFDTSTMDTGSSLVDSSEFFDFDILDSSLELKELQNYTHSAGSMLSSTTSSEPDLLQSIFFDELFTTNTNTYDAPVSVKSPVRLSTKNTIRSNIYKWTNNFSETLSSLNTLDLEVEKLNPDVISKSVSLTICKELDLHDQYLKTLSIGQFLGHSHKRRKRRNPQYDNLEWLPVSLFQAAYTNIKNNYLDKTDYQYRIPRVSCFGKVNMRVKRAWTRSANKTANLEHTFKSSY